MFAIRLLGIVVSIICGALVYGGVYYALLPLTEGFFQTDAAAIETASLMLAAPSLTAALIAGFAAGMAGGALWRIGGLIGGLLLALGLLAIYARLAPISVDPNLPIAYRMVPLIGPGLIALFGTFAGELIISLFVESMAQRLARRQAIMRAGRSPRFDRN